MKQEKFEVGELFRLPEVSKENIGTLRQQVAFLREDRRFQWLAVMMAARVREEAERVGLWSDVVGLWWEEYLVGKHMLMAADRYAWMPGVVMLRRLGLWLMRRAVTESTEVIERHRDDDEVQKTAMRLGRFAGELAMLEGNYEEAERQFGEAVGVYAQHEDPEVRVNALELRGFLAEALIRGGKREEGRRLMVETWRLYEKEDLGGRQLKERDYYTWAVWRSGCVIKAARALLDGGWDFEREEIKVMLGEAREMLTNPPEKVEMWGDVGMRLGEIEGLRKRLEK